MREKKNNWKGFALGMVIVALLAAMAVPALATSGKKQLKVEYTGLYLHVDGIPVEASSNGNEPFVCEGTTYLPVRAVGEALGKDVRWDGPTHTVYITDPDPATSEPTKDTEHTKVKSSYGGKKTIDVDYLDIKLVVNGKEVIPKDVNGKVVEPFAYNGTTYLPVRAVGEALGKTVRWDGETKTVHLGELPQATYLVDACKTVSGDLLVGEIYRAAYHRFFQFDGKRYSQGFRGCVPFELGGKYESLTFDYINYSYKDPKYPTELYIYLDGKIAQTIQGIPEGGSQTVTVPLNYAQTIYFVTTNGVVCTAVLHGERAVTKPVPPENATYLVDVCTVNGGHIYKGAGGEDYCKDLFGNKYANGFTGFGDSSVVVKLNGKYKTLKATIFNRRGGRSASDLKEETFIFSVDGETVKEIALSRVMAPQTIEIPLNYGMELTIGGENYFLADAILE